MNWWNFSCADRQWNNFWGAAFGTLYLLTIFFTALSPEWRLVSAGLFGYALSWFVTTFLLCQQERDEFLLRRCLVGAPR